MNHLKDFVWKDHCLKSPHCLDQALALWGKIPKTDPKSSLQSFMDVCRRQRREDKCLDGTWCGDRLSKAVNASLLFLTCSQLILTFSMFLTLSLPAKRPRPMIGKGITKGTKKQSTLIYSGDVTRVKYVSHSKCADGQVAIRRTIRLGDSANSFLERERVCLCFTSGMNWDGDTHRQLICHNISEKSEAQGQPQRFCWLPTMPKSKDHLHGTHPCQEKSAAVH